jgi:hypothetical protein
MKVEANFQILPNELEFHVLQQLDLKTLLKCCWNVSREWHGMAQEIARPRALQLAERLGLPKDASLKKTCVRVKELARVCGIEAEGKTLEALVGELQEKADKIEGIEGGLPYLKLLLNKVLDVSTIRIFNDPKNTGSLSGLLPDMIKKGLTADQVFLMAEYKKNLYDSSYGFKFLADQENPERFLSDPNLSVLLQSAIANVQFDRMSLGVKFYYYNSCLKDLLNLKDKVNDKQQKDRLDEVIVSLIKKVEPYKFKLNEKRLDVKCSDKVSLALIQAGENIAKSKVIELAEKYPENELVVNRANEIKNRKLKNIIKVIVEVTAFAFALIGYSAFVVAGPPAAEIFAPIFILPIFALHVLFWGKLSF